MGVLEAAMVRKTLWPYSVLLCTSCIDHPQSFIQVLGRRSSVLISATNHLLGAMTSLSRLEPSHAPHQLNELFAMIWCLHALMSRISSKALGPVLCSTKTQGPATCRLACTHGTSSANTDSVSPSTRD